MRHAGALCFVLCLVGAASAGKASDAADKVVEAFKSKLPLKELAAADDPDPWMVAEELCRRGELKLARAFAEAAPRPDTKRLPAYVAGAGEREAEPGAVEAVRAYESAFKGRKSPAEQLATLAKVKGDRDDVTSVLVHFSRGWAHTDMRDIVSATASWQRAGELAARLGWFSLAETAFNGATNHAIASGDLKTALACAKAQLDASTQRSHVRGVIYARNAIGLCYRNTGEYDEALKHLQEAMDGARKAGMDEFAAKVQLNIVSIHTARSDYDRALEVGEAARAAFDAAGDRASGGKIRIELATVYVERGELLQAKKLYEEGHAMLRGIRHPDAAIALLNLAGVEARLGDVRGAARKFRTLSGVFKSRQDFHRAGQCRMLLGRVYADLADYERALEEYEEALSLLERVGDKRAIADTHASLGSTRSRMGRNDLALAHYDEALAIYRKIGVKSGVALMLKARGSLYWTIGEDEKGEKLLREAHALWEEIGNRREATRMLGILAAVLTDRGRLEESLETLQEVLAGHRRDGDAKAEALVLHNLGVMYGTLKKYEKALSHFDQAIKKQDRLGDLEGKSISLAGAAEMHEKLGRREKAYALFEESAKIATDIGAHRMLIMSLTSQAWGRLGADPERSLALAKRALDSLPGLVRGLGDEEGASARTSYGDVFEVGARAALERKDAAAACLFLESGRAGSLLEALGGRDSIRGAVIPEKLRILETKAERDVAEADARNRAALASGEFKRAKLARKQRAAARAELLEVQNRIRREAKRAANVLYPTVKPLADIQAALKANEALVEYGLYRRSLALVITKDDARVVPLSAGDEIEAACAALEVDDREASYAEALDALRAEVVAPLELPDSVQRVLVSPQGALAYVPAVLLFPGKDVAYLPSGTTYLHLREEARDPGEEVLALGDPDYGDPEDEGEGLRKVGRMKLQPLPATRAEAKTVGTVTLLGEEATEEMLRDTLEEEEPWRAVHLACHGIVNAEHPRLSALALTQDGDDDGLLSVLEIYRMKVPSNLVVLSACETGRGKVYRAEGVVGFTRAFMFAGAPRVIVSLWEVDDDSTSALMVKFYELWKKGRSAAEALRQAQEFIKAQEKWMHPHFWAAWQLWGLPD